MAYLAKKSTGKHADDDDVVPVDLVATKKATTTRSPQSIISSIKELARSCDTILTQISDRALMRVDMTTSDFSYKQHSITKAEYEYYYNRRSVESILEMVNADYKVEFDRGKFSILPIHQLNEMQQKGNAFVF